MRARTDWRRTVVIAAATCTMLLAGSCSQPYGPPAVAGEGSAAAATKDEQRAILVPVLRHYLRAGFTPSAPNPRRVVLATQTAMICLLSSAEPCARLQEASFQRLGKRPSRYEQALLGARNISDGVVAMMKAGEVPQVMGQGLMEANQQAAPVDREGLPDFVVPLAKDDLHALISKGDWRSDWTPFHAIYPDAAGYAEVSTAVVSHDRRHAMIFVRFRCGSRCGGGDLHRLDRK